MGLDSYLHAVRYYSGEEGKNILSDKTVDYPVDKVFLEVAYWRKANCIHNWFVEAIQGGQDDCHEHYVRRERLEELSDKCQEILSDRSKAPKLLPTKKGPFFGSMEYDEDYFDDLESTVKQLEKALQLPTQWEFFYRSSW